MNWDCLILAAAGKVLPFPLGPHSPPICKASGTHCIPPGQVSTGSRAMTGAPCCQKRTVLHRHFLAHHFLFLPIWSCSFSTFSSAIPQVHSGTSPSLQNGISLQYYGTGNMPTWLQRSFYLLILCQWAGEVFCNLHQIQQNSKERLTGSIITGDAGNEILTGKCQTQHSSPICHCAKSNAVENRLTQGLQMKVAF